MKRIMAYLLTGICMATAAAQTCPEKKITTERLPDLITPRHGHSTFVAGGEITVAGGHTTGFIPVKTAERLSNGAWQEMTMTYTHDEGFALPMKSGLVLLGGGHLQPLGIGNQFVTEEYNPTNHTFKSYGCMDRKRCWAQGLEMDSGHVVISGNWYEGDGIELYERKINAMPLKDVHQQRAMPFLFRTAKDDAIIFSSFSERAKQYDTIWIDHLKGAPTTEPLFEKWQPLSLGHEHRSMDSFIGDEAKGIYTYLMAVEDTLTHQAAIMKLANGQFSLLKTETPVPRVSQGDTICWFSQVIADRQAGRAYLLGYGKQEKRLYILYIMYQDANVPLALGYTEPIPDMGYTTPVLTAEGNLVIAGGVQVPVNNFEPKATVVLLPVGDKVDAAGNHGIGGKWRWWLYALLAVFGVFIGYKGFKHFHHGSNSSHKGSDFKAQLENAITGADNKLMGRIDELMEREQLFLNPELKVGDVAAILGVNSRYVSDSINASRDCSFAQFMNRLRVEYAQHMMQQSPEKKLSEVWVASGFANESTFFRAFKSITGITPKEWINNISTT